MTGIEIARIVVEAGQWFGSMLVAWLNGDDGEMPRRVAELLPAELRSDLEHARQASLLRQELDGDLELDSIDDDEEIHA